MGAAAVTDRRRGGRFTEDGVFGMALVVFVEVMLFAGFFSAFIIAEQSVQPGLWPPPNQPRLPVESTALNTLALLASGGFLFVAQRAFAKRGHAAAAAPMGIAVLLGAAFVGFQGMEWARLLGQGLTVTSSQLGSFFYTIVGAHALHAVAALLALAIQWPQMRSGRLGRGAFGAAALFWYFVVLIWPAVYLVVYL